MKANRACIHESHRIIGNKEAVIKGCRSICVYTPGHSAEVAGKNALLPVSPWKGFDHILSQLLP